MMGKGMACVIAYSFFIIIIFCVMVYLITTIDPPPLASYVPDKIAVGGRSDSASISPTPAPLSPAPVTFPVSERRKFNNLFFDDGGSVPIIDPAQYGLEKAESDEIDFYPATIQKVPNNNVKNRTDMLRFMHRKVIPPLWPHTPQTVIIDPTMHKAMHQIWLTPFVTPSMLVDSTTKNFYYEARNYTGIRANINATSEKPMKRRSVSNRKYEDYSGSVLLKILDNNGLPRIEINIGPEGIIQKKKSESIFSMQDANNSQHKNTEFKKDTIITIMANDTIVIDDIESETIIGQNISDVSNKTVLFDILTPLTSKIHENLKNEKNIDHGRLLVNKTTASQYRNTLSEELGDNKTRYAVNNIDTTTNVIKKNASSTIKSIKINNRDDTTINNNESTKDILETERMSNISNKNMKESNISANLIYEPIHNNYTKVFIKKRQ